MKARLVVDIRIDDAALEFRAKRSGLSLSRALESVLSEGEGRIASSLKSVDAIEQVNVERLRRDDAKVNA